MKNANSITNKTPLQDASLSNTHPSLAEEHNSRITLDMFPISSRNKNYICPYLAGLLKVKIVSRVNDSSCLYEVTKATAKRS